VNQPHEAVPAVVDHEGISLQRLEPQHAAVVAALLGTRGNQFILDIPADEAMIGQALADLPKQPWTLPLAAVRDGECLGVVTTALPNVKSLHANLTALFADPEAARLPLAMCVRHLFWNFPLHRLYAQIPDMDLTREYIDLLTSVGFEVEGRLMAHAVVGGRPFDMVALGLLRTDFERWCVEHEPVLALD
jgi:hypothetical protein